MSAWSANLDRWLVPARRRGVEILDDPTLDWSLRRRSHQDIERSNQWLGGFRAVEHGLREVLPTAPTSPVVVLDVGAGAGATLRLVERVASRLSRPVERLALDIDPHLAATATPGVTGICGSLLELPLRSKSVDVITCSLLLHHFDTTQLPIAIAELNRVARHRVVIHDLRRSWVAVAGLWGVSFVLAFHPVSRHDGMTSILRGFTPSELCQLIRESTGVEPTVERHWGFRLLASWQPGATAIQPGVE